MTYKPSKLRKTDIHRSFSFMIRAHQWASEAGLQESLHSGPKSIAGCNFVNYGPI